MALWHFLNWHTPPWLSIDCPLSQQQESTIEQTRYIYVTILKHLTHFCYNSTKTLTTTGAEILHMYRHFSPISTLEPKLSHLHIIIEFPHSSITVMYLICVSIIWFIWCFCECFNHRDVCCSSFLLDELVWVEVLLVSSLLACISWVIDWNSWQFCIKYWLPFIYCLTYVLLVLTLGIHDAVFCYTI